MRSFLNVTVFLTTLLAIVLGGGFIYGYSAWVGAGPLSEMKTVIIERGSGVSSIAQELQKAKVISSATIFKAVVRISNKQTSLKAGEYEFEPRISMHDVLDKIARGQIVQRHITIAEGLTSWQVIQIINAADGLTGVIEKIPAEGSLLPETYSFTRDQNRAEIIRGMESSMERTIDALWPKRMEGLPFDNPKQALVLASIVEKETGIASERARIAGVFVNRLRAGMPLQTDPTVIYALTKGEIKNDGMGPLGRRLLRKDLLETDSPYNTYKYPGLPPGPIANPGRAAIEATLHPEQHDFFYFVADGTGGHVFSKTLKEHEINVVKWRKIRKEQGN